MSAGLAVASALVFGAADFLGGVATRRAPVLAVTATSHLAGALALALVAMLLPGEPVRADLIWGFVSGLAGGVGLLSFYAALAAGTMSVVSPITAAVSATVPFAAGLGLGERPAPLAVLGVAFALAAVVLVAVESPSPLDREVDVPGVNPVRMWGPLVGALAAGLGFGLFFVLLAQSGGDAGLWPLLAARGGSLLLYGAVAGVVTARRGAPGGVMGALMVPRGVAITAISAGLLDMAANSLYLIAVSGGLLSLIAVLASLYPVSTILLARTFLNERLGGVQWAGVSAALLAVALIS